MEAIKKAEIEPSLAEITMIPQSSVKVSGRDAERVLRLMELLEDHEDVQNVWANFDIPEETMSALE